MNKNRKVYYTNINNYETENKFISNNISYNNSSSSILNYKKKNKNLSEKIVNKYKNKIKIF